jgi:hypothetical protein
LVKGKRKRRTFYGEQMTDDIVWTYRMNEKREKIRSKILCEGKLREITARKTNCKESGMKSDPDQQVVKVL